VSDLIAEGQSAGAGAGVFLIAAGQAAGSPAAGALAGATDLATAFYASAALAVAAACLKPHAQDAALGSDRP